MYFVYILHSCSLNKYYVGQTNNLDNRLSRHNSGRSKSTKPGIPWKLIFSLALPSRSDAMILEKKIKKRGAKRYLNDINYRGVA